MRVLPRGRMPLGRRDGIKRGRSVAIAVDGEEILAYAGETVAAVLIARDGPVIRRTARGATRGLYCGMGACFDCLVVVDDVPNTRACMTVVAAGMRVSRQDGHGLTN